MGIEPKAGAKRRSGALHQLSTRPSAGGRLRPPPGRRRAVPEGDRDRRELGLPLHLPGRQAPGNGARRLPPRQRGAGRRQPHRSARPGAPCPRAAAQRGRPHRRPRRVQGSGAGGRRAAGPPLRAPGRDAPRARAQPPRRQGARDRDANPATARRRVRGRHLPQARQRQPRRRHPAQDARGRPPGARRASCGLCPTAWRRLSCPRCAAPKAWPPGAWSSRS